MTDPYATFEDRIVAEFADGHDVEGIAARHGLTVPQVYAIVERTVGPPPPPPPGYYAPHPGPYPPPGYYAPQPAPYSPPQGGYHPPGVPSWVPNVLDEDAIVAEYGDGHDVEAIAHKHGITPDQVLHVVQRALADGS
ncbi:hypothetical protein [Paractinoplanes atraurantiacus]|uniref:Uncharacterized protein n=1 Tax=Paractinoplanes atraurantiacus TaxID=1036182 RepID=A0A285IQH1_9ACTN|nr:hypothetical protein [Actinoplanes atraurantiacus]SNY50270.1 hypothetical protein SAMN05421748_110277 [Actinoplanes atraurantiacus]